MAPIKLEDHIREQFEEREIAPSANAWEKLEVKLNQEQGKIKPVIFWYAIAASIVGILLIVSQFFNGNNKQSTQDFVETDAPIEKIIPSEMLNTETQLAKENQVIEEKTVPSAKQETRSSVVLNSSNNVKKTQEHKIITPAIVDNSVVEQKNNKSLNTTGISEGSNISEAINKQIVFNDKVEEVVAAVNKIKQEKNTVSAAEIDALLLRAQRDIATERMLNETKIDATALLEDVELELEKSFRDKVFDALGDSFSKIRTAVVERNN